MSGTPVLLRYVLISPARNEASFIGKTIDSMLRQSVKPVKWVIVNDGSSDTTAELVRQYLPQHPWMELVDLPVHRDRSFAAKVGAFNAGYARIQGLDYDVIGNLDSDISFGEDYCEFILKKFAEDAQLGVAGTIFEEDGYSSAADSFEGQTHVAGGCQMFRRRCFEALGGYVPNKAGGIDWIAVTTARMMGWKTRSFRERSFFHHRSLGTSERGVLASAFSYGEKDYYLGGHPVWELSRVVYQATKRPYMIAAAALLGGYLWAFLRRTERPVSPELIRFHRKEQMLKLRTIVKSLLRFRRIDSFRVIHN